MHRRKAWVCENNPKTPSCPATKLQILTLLAAETSKKHPKNLSPKINTKTCRLTQLGRGANGDQHVDLQMQKEPPHEMAYSIHEKRSKKCRTVTETSSCTACALALALPCCLALTPWDFPSSARLSSAPPHPSSPAAVLGEVARGRPW